MSEPTLYERLGVSADAPPAALRSAYRQLAQLAHPDRGGAAAEMALLNEAWHVLSDPERRYAYDRGLVSSPPAGREAQARPSPTRVAAPGPGPTVVGWRRQTWVAHQRNQVRRLASQAARSSVQTLLLRHPPVGREAYERHATAIIGYLLVDTEQRLRDARQAGASPLDLANATALVGLRRLADQVAALWRAQPGLSDLRMQAELIDRMWDVMAHEMSHELTQLLGGAPRIARRLR